MKKKLLLNMLVVFCTINALAQSTNGLVAHWGFNSIVNDSIVTDLSGNNHNGVLHGNITAATGQSGLPNTAYYFHQDPSYSTYIIVPYSPAFNLVHYSICAIVKHTSFYTGICQGNTIISRGNDADGSYWVMNTCDNPFNDCNTVDTTKFVFQSIVANAQYTESDLQYTPTISLNNWYTAIVTFDGVDTRTYINGYLKAIAPMGGGSIGNSTDYVSIGDDVLNSAVHPSPFIGMMDDLQIYNRVLTDSEISIYTPTAVTTINKQATQINIYPNPARDIIIVQSSIEKESNITIANIAGQIVQADKINGKEKQLSISGLVPGVYFLHLQNDEESTVAKFTKE